MPTDPTIELLKREWEAGTAAFLIARRIGMTTLHVIALASRHKFRRPWTRRDYRDMWEEALERSNGTS